MDPTQNNGFGNQIPANMGYSGAPMNTGGAGGTGGAGTGDIILAPEKKSKKWWIVGGVVGAVGVIIVVWLVLSNGLFNGGKISLRKTFNEFANYVLYGEEKDDEIDVELDTSYDYYFNNNMDNTEMYDTVDELFSDFFNLASRSLNANTEGDLIKQIGDERELLSFMRVIYPVRRPVIKDVIEKYSSNGREATVSFFNDYYDYSTLLDNDYADTFKEDFEYWVETAVDLVSLYVDNNCLSNGELDDSCERLVGDGEKDKLLSDKKSEYLRADAFLAYDYGLSINFVLRVFVINALINDYDIFEYVSSITPYSYVMGRTVYV